LIIPDVNIWIRALRPDMIDHHRSSAKGNLVADSYHAALAIKHGAVFVTNDHDFASFRGLTVRSPFG
jgi:predicted nucleic acid-binding protein